MRYFFLLFTLTFALTAKIHCIASIPPIKSLVESIGGKEVEVSVMVPPGSSPHSYEPKASQMRAVENADCYFAVGVEFEKAWLPRFQSQNPRMKIVDLSAPIQKFPMAGHHHHEADHEGEHEESGLDPHIWTAPSNLKIMAKQIAQTLEKLDPAHRDLYLANLKKVDARIDETDRKIRKILSVLPPHSRFMVFHPAWGYFAREYGLLQIPVEIEGKAPKPRQLMALIDEARKERIRAIFVQPEFSDKSARLLAGELHIPVIKISPLAADWSDNLLRLAKAIAGAAE